MCFDSNLEIFVKVFGLLVCQEGCVAFKILPASVADKLLNLSVST